ncbi:MAG: hypothetical protein JGK26_09765 [Microcoleus sp. PH2017_27_LUM_O_A]|nr:MULTISPECIES: hypothetical protein [unclassified Microcoleus]MCC3460060.1 hypothetical protein [Microcoleus sp. PH2017_11_PCY_U_A]MCC3559411.1 hypothetical protein [Microcoleus sp. PH2017_27_LUM_O_A]
MRRGFEPPADCATKQTNFQSVSGRSNLREMCDRVFCGWGRSGFLWMGDGWSPATLRVFCGWAIDFWETGDRVFCGWAMDGAPLRYGFLGGWAIGL